MQLELLRWCWQRSEPSSLHDDSLHSQNSAHRTGLQWTANSRITGDAQQNLQDTDANGTDTVQKLTMLLCNRYIGSRQSDERYRIELSLRRLRSGASVIATSTRPWSDGVGASDVTLQGRDTIACDYCIDALDYAHFALIARRPFFPPSTMQNESCCNWKRGLKMLNTLLNHCSETEGTWCEYVYWEERQ